mmetsp:Transcript_29460/g.58984  ORF Transcript_29460/g.58984 Transcript_29460/m.58984 type:complete len:219 (+) Transcript_29460:2598-3254(+)
MCISPQNCPAVRSRIATASSYFPICKSIDPSFAENDKELIKGIDESTFRRDFTQSRKFMVFIPSIFSAIPISSSAKSASPRLCIAATRIALISSACSIRFVPSPIAMIASLARLTVTLSCRMDLAMCCIESVSAGFIVPRRRCVRPSPARAAGLLGSTEAVSSKLSLASSSWRRFITFVEYDDEYSKSLDSPTHKYASARILLSSSFKADIAESRVSS